MVNVKTPNIETAGMQGTEHATAPVTAHVPAHVPALMPAHVPALATMLIVVCVIPLFLMLSSCQKGSDQSGSGQKAGTANTEPQDTRLQTIDRSRVVAARADIENLRTSMASFYAAQGRYPKDLEEFEGFTGVPLDKSIYNYDPATGKLSLK